MWVRIFKILSSLSVCPLIDGGFSETTGPVLLRQGEPGTSQYIHKTSAYQYAWPVPLSSELQKHGYFTAV